MSNIAKPAETYTLTDFISTGRSDEQTYHNFSITRSTLEAQFVDFDVIDFYLDNLKTYDKANPNDNLCVQITEFSEEEIAKYKYQPDLLAYDLYGSVQLDFLILLCNGIIDPKEFDFNRGYLLLPKKVAIKKFLSHIYNAEKKWLDMNT